MSKSPSLLAYHLVRVFPLAAVAMLLVALMSQALVREEGARMAARLLQENAQQVAELYSARLLALEEQVEGLAANDLVSNGLVDTESRNNYLPVFFRSLRWGQQYEGSIALYDYRGRVLAANDRGVLANAGIAQWLDQPSPSRRELVLDDDGLTMSELVYINGLPEGALTLRIPDHQLASLFALQTDTLQVFVYSTNSPESASWQTANWSSQDSEEHLFSRPVPLSGPGGLEILVAQSAEQANADVARLLRLHWAMLAILLAALLISIWLAAYLGARKGRTLAAQVSEMAEARNLDKRIDIDGPREIEDVAKSFNHLLDSLQESVTSRAHVESILLSLNESLVVTDASGRIQMMNPLARQLAQLIRGQEAQSIQDFFENLTSKADHLAAQVFVSQEEEGQLEVNYQLSEQTMAIIWSRTPLVSRGGTFEGSIYTARDVTEDKRLLEKLNLLNRAVESAPTGISIADARLPDAPLIYVNPAFFSLTGYSEQEALGKNCRFLQGSDRHQPEIDRLRDAIQQQVDCQVLLRNYRKDGTLFWNELTLSPVRDEAGAVTHFLGVTNDVTERQKLETLKSELVATLSHELRTPMTAILGSLKLIRNGVAGDLPDKALPVLDIALSSSHRLLNLINDMLDLEKIEAGEMVFRMQPVQIPRLLDQAMKEMQPYADKFDVGLRVEQEAGSVTVKGDPERLLQVLVNLLSNAVKFSSAGGEVLTRTSLEDNWLVIEVRDRGPGIPAEFHEQMFSKFSQADGSDQRKVGGTGLGLSIAKAIVEAHRGDIGFKTSAAEGTTLFVRLMLLSAEFPRAE